MSSFHPALVECETSNGETQMKNRDDVVWCRCMALFYTEKAHEQIPCRCQDEEVLDWESRTGREYNCMEDSELEESETEDEESETE